MNTETKKKIAIANNNKCSFISVSGRCVQVVIKEKVLELLLYFTRHEDEEVKTKAIIGLGKRTVIKHDKI